MVSIVDYLKSVGTDSSFNNRKNIAKQYGINNYKGTAAQNIQLLNVVSKGKTTTKKSTRTSDFVDLQNEFGLSPFSKRGMDKAKELAAINPNLKFVCDASGCAEIANRAAAGDGYNYPRTAAWDYGNQNKVVYSNPNYDIKNKSKNEPLHNPTEYNIPNEVKSAKKGQMVGMNRKNNVVDNAGKKLTTRKGVNPKVYMADNKNQANDSYDYANEQLYPNSRGYEHVGYVTEDGKLLHGTGPGKNHKAYYNISDLNKGPVNLGEYGAYEPVEVMQRKGYYDKLKDLIGYKSGGKYKRNINNKYEYGGRIGDESFLGRTSKVGLFVGIDTIPKRKLTPKVGIGKYQWALANGAMKPQHNSGLQVRSKMGGKVKKYQTAGNTGLSPIKNLSDIRGNAGYDSTGKKSTTIMNPTFTGGFNNTLATFNPNLQFAGSKLVSKDINAGLLHSRANFDLKSDYSNNNGKQLLNNSAQYNNGMFNAGVTSKVGTDQKPIYGVSAGVNLNGIKATGGFEYGDNKRTSNVAATADGYRGSGSVNYNRVYDEKTGNATTTAGATYASRKGLTTGIDYTGGTGNKSVDAKVGFTGDNGYVQGNVGYGTNNANANIAGEYNNTGVTKKGNQWSVGVKGGMTFGKKFGGTVKKKVYMTGGKLFDSGGDMNFNALKEQRKKLGPNVTYSMTNVFGKDKQENGWIFGSNSEPKPETTLPKINNVMKVETKPGQLITQMPPLKSLEANTNNYLADVNSFKEQVAHIESRGNYNAMNKDTKATGKYQFIPRYHKEEVARLFGVDWNTFYTKPELQERYMDYWTEKTLRPTAQKLLAQYPNAGYNINQLMGMVHFQGEGGARSQLKQGTTNTKVGYNAITTDQYVKRIK